MLRSSRPAVSSLSAAIPYVASRRTAPPGSVTLVSRADAVPCKAATDLAKGRAWSDTEEVTGSNPVAPTPILAGHGVAGVAPVALATWPGRTGAARRPRRRARLVLPGPSTRTSGPLTTTESSRDSRPSWPPTRHRAATPRQPTPLPERRRQRRDASLAAAWPPGRSGAASRPSPTRPRPPPTLPRRPPHDLRGGARTPVPPRAVDRAAGDGARPPGPHGTRLDPVVTATRRTELSPIAPPG
jgi:hypothetical protein